MKKALYILICLLFTVWTAESSMAQNSKKYVRQKVQPNFFIPSGALAESKPEKVYVPQYRKGKTTAKHISVNDNSYAAKTPVPRTKTAPAASSASAPENTAAEPDYQSATPAPSQIDDGTPNYQKMYQDYLQDLESIAKTGNVSDPAVLNDLEAMNSEKRIELDKNFNQKRNVKKDISSALR